MKAAPDPLRCGYCGRARELAANACTDHLDLIALDVVHDDLAEALRLRVAESRAREPEATSTNREKASFNG